MPGNNNSQLHEKRANVFMAFITVVGWSTIIISSFDFEIKSDPLILALMILFLGVAEFFPMPVWKGFTSISFPLVYTIWLVYGLHLAILIFGVIVCAVSIMQQRPLRIIFFNPAQLAISLYLAAHLTSYITGNAHVLQAGLTGKFIEMIILTLSFYFINNLIVDAVLKLRPQPYPFTVWKQKTLSETRSLALSLFYISLLLILGSQNRGIIDVFSFFFFFSPLVGLSLLTSIIVRLQTEKNRLKSLFDITTELNRLVLSTDSFTSLRSHLRQFIDFESAILWINENDRWDRVFQEGSFLTERELSRQEIENFEMYKEPFAVFNRKDKSSPADICFDKQLKALVHAPLVIENNTVGMLIVGRSRTKSFTQEDVRSIATLANQLAIIFKTRTLREEQERRLLLEERNRIAREIHDGIAQSLAGAVMKLETATKKYGSNSAYALELVEDSIEKLRVSLREIRESIYALRPYPTERLGLIQSMNSVIEAIKREHSVSVVFEERGKPIPLSSMVEKVMFDIFKESMQNIGKHALAEQVHILLSYQSEHILLKICDDGSGFSLMDAMLKARREPHFGILNMNESAEKIEATLQIDSKPGHGTEVILIIPKIEYKGGINFDQSVTGG